MRNDEYFAIKDRAAERFMKLPHVNAVGIGARERRAAYTGEIAIKVYVTRKKPIHEVPPDELIPDSFEGILTDVVQMSPVKHQAAVPGVESIPIFPDINAFDPLRGGISLSTEGQDIGIGTLGCMLRDKEDGSAMYALTNFHVIALDGKLSRSARVSHPSTPGFTFDPDVAFGIVSDGGEPGIRDAAIVRLDEGQRWIPFVHQIGYLRGRGSHDVTVEEIRTGTFQVRKRGVATFLTGGVVESISDTNIENIRRKNTMFIRPNRIDGKPDVLVHFAARGDSGAVLVSDANEVVGLFFASEGIDVNNPTETSGYGFAYRIGTVLGRFQEVDGLDLEVAVAKNADASDPNDPREREVVPFPAGVPAMSGPEQVKRGDHRYYRPLVGGAQIMAEPILGDANSGTLGCIVTELANPDIAYVLTAYSAVSANGSIPPTTDTDVGQPNNQSSCSGCCSNTVGAFARAGPDAGAPTATIVRLKDDQKWLAEIMRIGLIEGSDTVTDEDIRLLGPIEVWKAGAASRLTSGIVVRVPDSTSPLPPGVPADAMLIRPHSDPLRPNAEVHFSRFVDRGAALVKRGNAVVGVLYDEVPLDDPDGRRVVHGIAAPIAAVLASLKAQTGIDFEVPIAQKINVVHTTNLSVAVAPEELAVLQSPGGAAVIDAYRRHEDEVRGLIERNRRVATAWHRNGGPALVQAVISALRTPSATIPAHVNGVPTGTCLDRLYTVFSRYGSAELRADMARARSRIPSMVGLSIAEIVAALTVLDPVSDAR